MILDGLGEPDAPFHLIDGDDQGKTFVDVAALRGWHAKAVEPA